MNEQALKTYFEIYTACWKLFKKYSNSEQSEEYWQALNEDSEAIYKKYGSTQFVADMLRTTRDELQRLENNGK